MKEAASAPATGRAPGRGESTPTTPAGEGGRVRQRPQQGPEDSAAGASSRDVELRGGGARRARVEGSRGREAVVATKGLRRAGGGVRWGEVGGVRDSTPPVKENGEREK